MNKALDYDHGNREYKIQIQASVSVRNEKLDNHRITGTLNGRSGWPSSDIIRMPFVYYNYRAPVASCAIDRVHLSEIHN